MAKTTGFEDFRRTGRITYPVHVYTRTAMAFWATLGIPVFVTLATYLKDGPVILGAIGGLVLAVVYYIGCVVLFNLFGRRNGYLVGSINVYKDRVDLLTLTPFGFSLGRVISLEMREFSGISLQIGTEKGRFDDYIATLTRGDGGDDVRLGEIDISGNQEIASKAIQQFADDLNLPVNTPGALVVTSGRAPVRRASQPRDPAPPAEPTPAPTRKPLNPVQKQDAQEDPDTYNF
jgi:hypothetical protein